MIDTTTDLPLLVGLSRRVDADEWDMAALVVGAALVLALAVYGLVCLMLVTR